MGLHSGNVCGAATRAAVRIGFVCVLLTALARPADANADPLPDFDAYTPRLEAVRIAEDEAPVIDGDLSDPAWARAAVIEDFYQVEPRDGAPPGQETRAYVMFDRRNLYVAVHAFDKEPEKIIARLMRRDPPLRDDDGVRIILDPFGTRRNGYFFATNPNGARVDALLENNETFRDEWDVIWDVDAQVVEDGWIAEFRIPFQSISFDASLDAWGLQIIRVIRRNNEEVRWSNVDQSRGRIDLTNIGRLGGVQDIDSGIGLEAQLFLAGTANYDWETGEADPGLRPSGNLFYKITPSLTGSLTYKPDFSDAPLDARQVNTGRFDLFFPETRDFFLQDLAVFEFGGRALGGENGLPFFTRNTGSVDGRPVDIIGGAKLSGQAGPASVGLITSRTAAIDDLNGAPVDGQTLSAGRVSIPLFAESKAGVVFTHGDPTGAAENTVAGADFQFRNSTRWPGQLFVDLAWQRSFDDEGDGVVADDMAGFEAAYRSQGWNWTLAAQEIGEDYQPRPAPLSCSESQADEVIEESLAGRPIVIRRPNGRLVRQIEGGVFATAITDQGDRLLDRFWGGWAEVETNDGDSVFARAEVTYLDIRAPFAVAGVVPVDVGVYEFVEQRIEARLTDARPVGLGVEYAWGDIYDGRFEALEVEYSLRPNKHLSFAGSYEYSAFDLPNGEIAVHVGAIQSVIAFSPWMTLSTDIQYDNISENVTFFSRFRWEPQPEREIFLAVGHAAAIDRTDFPSSFRARATDLALRFGHVFRF